jgi:hypothetical protein
MAMNFLPGTSVEREADQKIANPRVKLPRLNPKLGIKFVLVVVLVLVLEIESNSKASRTRTIAKR